MAELDPALRGYAICTEPRSGSSYVAQLFRSTGVLGLPREYLNAPALRRRIADYPEETERQVVEITTRGATANGVYGLKLFCEHFDRAAPAQWPAQLPALSFIHLERRDLVGQAISLHRAIQTQQWTAREAAMAEPVFDGARIESLLAHIVRAQARWRYYFARNNLPVLSLIYEDVVASPQRAVDQVADLIGLEETPRINQADEGYLTVQRDDLTNDWRSRFEAEFPDPTRFAPRLIWEGELQSRHVVAPG